MSDLSNRELLEALYAIGIIAEYDMDSKMFKINGDCYDREDILKIFKR